MGEGVPGTCVHLHVVKSSMPVDLNSDCAACWDLCCHKVQDFVACFLDIHHSNLHIQGLECQASFS